MNTLEISDTFEAYYDGRERFPHLPQPADAAKDQRKQRRAPDYLAQPPIRRVPPSAGRIAAT